ncbi:MAG: HEAT repeat domain-containing protein [Pirellulaceae bacterium]|nr:HEAT repeat domain-containing protein [Pirellulaceae bacterium]
MKLSARACVRLAATGLLAACIGCSSSAAPEKAADEGNGAAEPSSKQQASATKPAARPEFASVEAAFAEVERLASEPNAGPQRMQVERWFHEQGDRIAPELAAKLADAEADAATRMAACRVLARLGPTARPALLAACDGPPGPVRIKAIESLGRLQPADTATIAKLITLVDDDDRDVRRVAIFGLKNVGPPAKEAAPRLQAILNDVNEEETIRAAAKDALKSVDPRRTLVDS